MSRRQLITSQECSVWLQRCKHELWAQQEAAHPGTKVSLQRVTRRVRQEHLDVWFRNGPNDHASALHKHRSIMDGSMEGSSGTAGGAQSSHYFCLPGSKTSFRSTAENMGLGLKSPDGAVGEMADGARSARAPSEPASLSARDSRTPTHIQLFGPHYVL
mmetsp:Transcript_98489/g.195358  ORF Transcript_98489/g.195358 Transcript_98489/m.195358 type:complete len:159 (-) Transcript_98489:64-540(-)